MADLVLFRGEHGDYVAINPDEVAFVTAHRRDDPYIFIGLEGGPKDGVIVEGEFHEVIRRLRNPKEEKDEIEERFVSPRERHERREERPREERSRDRSTDRGT
jgi:hypothetical protein